MIKPGNFILIKPDLVLHKNQGGHDEECLYTQPSVVSAVIYYIIIALKEERKIVLGDAYQNSSKWFSFSNFLLDKCNIYNHNDKNKMAFKCAKASQRAYQKGGGNYR